MGTKQEFPEDRRFLGSGLGMGDSPQGGSQLSLSSPGLRDPPRLCSALAVLPQRGKDTGSCVLGRFGGDQVGGPHLLGSSKNEKR